MGLISLIAGGIHDANRAIKQNQAQGNDEVQNVVVNNQYSINVPTFLTPTNTDEAVSAMERAYASMERFSAAVLSSLTSTISDSLMDMT